jgi:hypothetical protein
MKKLCFPLSLVVIALTIIAMVQFNSCCKKKKTLTINYPIVDTGYAPALIVPPGLGFVYLNSVFSKNVYSDFNKRINDQDIDSSQVSSVKCDSMKMDIALPPGMTFGFIDSITALIAMKDSTNVQVLGTKSNIPDTATRITLNLRDLELRSYILQDSFKVIIGGRPDNSGANIPSGTLLRFITSFTGVYQE